MITALEPDILECEVKWALESITTNKASGGDGIPVELFHILKDDAVHVHVHLCKMEDSDGITEKGGQPFRFRADSLRQSKAATVLSDQCAL